jgi:hypothetical protein
MNVAIEGFASGHPDRVSAITITQTMIFVVTGCSATCIAT